MAERELAVATYHVEFCLEVTLGEWIAAFEAAEALAPLLNATRHVGGNVLGCDAVRERGAGEGREGQ